MVSDFEGESIHFNFFQLSDLKPARVMVRPHGPATRAAQGALGRSALTDGRPHVAVGVAEAMRVRSDVHSKSEYLNNLEARSGS